MFKKVAIIATVLVVFSLVGAYYYFSGKEYVLQLSESEIKTKLEEKMPFKKTYFFIFQITLNNPRVHLLKGSNEVKAGLDVIFNIKLNKNPKPLGGTVDITSGVSYLPEKGEFFLTNPKVENLTVQGLDSKYTDKANKALSKALAEYYKKHPIYRLSRTDAKQAMAKMVLKDVIIENKHLVIKLGI